MELQFFVKKVNVFGKLRVFEEVYWFFDENQINLRKIVFLVKKK
jgi:hypothetical protein